MRDFNVRGETVTAQKAQAAFDSLPLTFTYRDMANKLFRQGVVETERGADRVLQYLCQNKRARYNGGKGRTWSKL